MLDRPPQQFENPCAGAGPKLTLMERLMQNLNGVNAMIDTLNAMIPKFDTDTPEQTLSLETSTRAECDSASHIVEEQLTLQQAREKLNFYKGRLAQLNRLLESAQKVPTDPDNDGGIVGKF